MRPLALTLAAALGCSAPAGVAAQTAQVQSGEHANFTRLVTRLRADDWQVTQTGRTVVLTYPDYDQGFNVARVYDFIPRDRIANVTAAKGSLTLQLACDCVVGAFVERDTYVVIDVAANAAALETTPIKAQVVAEPATATVDAPQPATPTATAGTGLLPTLPTAQPLSPETLEVLGDVGTRLASELTTAAERGLLDANPDALPRKQQKPQIDTRVFSEVAPPDRPTPEQEVAPGTNLRITTSRDLPQTFRDLAEIVSGTGLTCPADDTLALATWGDTEPFDVQISKARQGLYGEFDRIDPKVALGLARSYLYFGFGAEARDTLRLAPALGDTADPLMAMSYFLDGETPPQPNFFSSLGGCESEAALWALLALPDPPSGALPNPDGAMRVLNALPAHLRQLLAPRVSEILRSYGDPKAAQVALGSLGRLPDALPTEARLAQAAIDLDKGDTEKATEQLRDVATDNDPQSPQALIALVDAQVAADQPVGTEVASLIEAYAQEQRDGPLGPALRRAHVLALTDAGQFKAAFAKAEDASDMFPFMLQRLTRDADDVTFLELSFDQSDSTLAALPPKDVIALAERQLSLGFAGRAELTLAQTPERPLSDTRQLLAARIALQMEKPAKANAALLGVADTAADPLRADAKRMLGAHGEAHQLYAQTNQPQNATETAWLSDDWQTLTPQDAPVFGPVARTAAGDEAAPTSVEGMLARSASLLEQSTEAREALQSLLTAQELQPEAPEQ